MFPFTAVTSLCPHLHLPLCPGPWPAGLLRALVQAEAVAHGAQHPVLSGNRPQAPGCPRAAAASLAPAPAVTNGPVGSDTGCGLFPTRATLALGGLRAQTLLSVPCSGSSWPSACELGLSGAPAGRARGHTGCGPGWTPLAAAKLAAPGDAGVSFLAGLEGPPAPVRPGGSRHGAGG